MKSFKEVYAKYRTRYSMTPDDKGDWFVYNGGWSMGATGEYSCLARVKQRYSKTPIIEHEIAGTALAFVATLWELLFTSPKLWTWFRGFITDGYWMVFSSPFILAYWIIVTILYLPFIVILATFSIIAIPYTELIEVPASWMNKESLYNSGDDPFNVSTFPFILGGKQVEVPNPELLKEKP